MRRFSTVFFIAALLAGLSLASTGCQSSGSREYQPGKGWVPN